MPPPAGFHIDWNDVGSLLSYFEAKRDVDFNLAFFDGRWTASYRLSKMRDAEASFAGTDLVEAARWLVRKHQTHEAELHRNAVSNVKAMEPALCSLCGKPMPKGEEMFNYHGSSGPCP